MCENEYEYELAREVEKLDYIYDEILSNKKIVYINEMEIIKNFSYQDIKLLLNELSDGPTFNYHKDVSKLTDILEKLGYNDTEFSVQKIFEKVFNISI